MLIKRLIDGLLMAYLFWIPPYWAATIAESLYPIVPDHFLHRIAWHESRGKRQGIHDGDQWVEAWAVRTARLDRTCAHHAIEYGAGTRGAFGLVAAHHVKYALEFGCFPWALFDVPIFSAIVAARKVTRRCKRHTRKCNANDLRIFWAGSHKPRKEVLARWAESEGLF